MHEAFVHSVLQQTLPLSFREHSYRCDSLVHLPLTPMRVRFVEARRKFLGLLLLASSGPWSG